MAKIGGFYEKIGLISLAALLTLGFVSYYTLGGRSKIQALLYRGKDKTTACTVEKDKNQEKKVLGEGQKVIVGNQEGVKLSGGKNADNKQNGLKQKDVIKSNKVVSKGEHKIIIKQYVVNPLAIEKGDNSKKYFIESIELVTSEETKYIKAITTMIEHNLAVFRNLKINSVNFKDRKATVDLTKKVNNSQPSDANINSTKTSNTTSESEIVKNEYEDSIILDLLLGTLFDSFKEIKSIQFTVDGKIVNTLFDGTDISKSFIRS